MKLTTSQIEALCLKDMGTAWFGRHYEHIEDCTQLSEDDMILVKKVTKEYYGQKTEYTLGKFISVFNKDGYQVAKYTEITPSLNKERALYYTAKSYNNFESFEWGHFTSNIGLLKVDEKTINKIVNEYEKEKQKRLLIEREKRIQAKKEAEAREKMERELKEQRRAEAEAYRQREIERRSKPYTMTVGEYEDIMEKISWLESMVEN